MKPIIRNLLIASAIAVVGFGIMAAEKIQNLAAIFQAMDILPNSLPKRLKFSNNNSLGIPQNVSFDIDIVLKNPTDYDFAVSGYVATLKKVNVFYKENFLGTANVNIDSISVPKKGFTVVKDIHIEADAGVILSNLFLISSISINDLIFTGVIEVLGVEYEIGN